MAITLFSRFLNYSVPTSTQIKSLTTTTVKVPVTSAPSAPAPVPVIVKPPLLAYDTTLYKYAPYLPSIAPRLPVTYQTMPAPISPAPVVAPEPEPLTPHKFSTCPSCGEEKVTAIAPVPALDTSPPAPAPTVPAPTPAPATPTAAPKRSGWLIAAAIVLLLTGGLALASAIRPRK